jgi:hypothetical protein
MVVDQRLDLAGEFEAFFLEIAYRPVAEAGDSAIATLAMGAMALGAMAVGTIAIGRLAIGNLVLKRGRARELHIGRMQIDELMIGRIVRRDDAGGARG